MHLCTVTLNDVLCNPHELCPVCEAPKGVPLLRSKCAACHDGWTGQMMSLQAGTGCASNRD
jgi:hypothetical protein